MKQFGWFPPCGTAEYPDGTGILKRNNVFTRRFYKNDVKKFLSRTAQSHGKRAIDDHMARFSTEAERKSAINICPQLPDNIETIVVKRFEFGKSAHESQYFVFPVNILGSFEN